MRRGRLVVASIVAGITMGTAPQGPVPTLKIEDLAFMSGAWTCEVWGGTFEEFWSKPAAGTMQGFGRHITDGKTTFMEFLSIEAGKAGELTMWIILGAPSKGEKKPVPFKLRSAEGRTAVFESPTNNFPSKITYRAGLTDRLTCRIEGIQNGKPAHTEFDFRAIGH